MNNKGTEMIESLLADEGVNSDDTAPIVDLADDSSNVQMQEAVQEVEQAEPVSEVVNETLTETPTEETPTSASTPEVAPVQEETNTEKELNNKELTDVEDMMLEVNARKDENKPEEPKKDKKKLFIIIGAVAALIIIILLIVLFTGGSKKEDNKKEENSGSEKNKKEDSDKDVLDDRVRFKRTENKMNVFLIDGSYVEDSYVTENNRAGKYTVTIDIEDLDARVLDVYPNKKYEKNEYPSYILFKDNGKIKYFSIKNKKSTILELSPDYNIYKLVGSGDNIKAIFYKKDSENGLYNLSSKKVMYKNSYKNYSMFGDNLLEAEKNDTKYYLLLNEEKIIGDSSEGYTYDKIGGFTVKVKDNLYTVFDSEFKEIATMVEKDKIHLEGDNIIIANRDNCIHQYDSTGKEIAKTTAFADVLMFTDKVFIARNAINMIVFGKYSLIKNNDVYAFDMSTKEISPAYVFKVASSGFRDRSAITENKEKGVYAYFEGVQVAIELYYNVDTGKVTEQVIYK